MRHRDGPEIPRVASRVAQRALLVSCVALCGGGTGLPRPAAGLAASGEVFDRASVDRTAVRSEIRADRCEPRPTRDDDGGRPSMERAIRRLQTAPRTEPSGDSLDPAIPAAADSRAAASAGVARAGGPATVRADGPDAFSYPAPGLSREDRRAFSVGNSFFRDNWVAAPASAEGRDGLGPHFAANSCSACHQDDGRGRPPLPDVGVGRGSVVFVSPWDDDGAPHPVYGAQLQDQAVEGVQREAAVGVSRSTRRVTLADGAVVELERFEPRIDAPAYGPLGRVRLSLRIGPQVIGMGLLEAVPDAALLQRADPDDLDGDGISGRAHMISGGVTGSVSAGGVSQRVGRFGWKASQPTLEGQVAAALAGDMGLTSAAHPDENHTPSQLDAVRAPRGGAPEVDEHKVARLAHYCRVLAVPAQRVPDDAEGRARIERGRAAFDRISCAACHAPTLRTGAASPVELLREVEFHPYTDLLLHDMGDGLADDRRDGDASGREWRTPPLWGLGLLERVHGETRLLHDGRARSVEEAVLWHGGEAARSRDAFAALSAEDRAALVAFVLSL